MSWREVEAGIGRAPAWAATGALALGVLAVATGLGPGAGPRTMGEVIASWLFFAGIAAGGAAFRAFFRIVDARWARPLASLGGVQAGFAPVAALLAAFILARAGGASAWVANPTGWLAPRSLAGRELVLDALLLGVAYLAFRPRPGRRSSPSRAMAIAYCLLFAVVLSVWAFDFVLGPDPVWGSTLIGPFVFVSAFIGGTAVATLLGLSAGALSGRQRRDAGALVFALAIFWAYLFWSQFLTLWYANLPDEIGFALRRAADGWGWVVLAVIGLVFAVPFVGLIHPAARRSSRFLGAVLVAQLAGLWLQFHLLVVPSLSASGSSPFTWRDLLVAAGMLGAFVLAVAPGVGRELAERRHGPESRREGVAAGGEEVKAAADSWSSV